MNLRAAVIMLFVATLLFVNPALAQDTTPVPGPEAAKHLPAAKKLGKGWIISQTVSPDTLVQYGFRMTPDSFREGAASIYLGPQGAQVVFVALLATSSHVAVRKSWDDASTLLDEFGSTIAQDFQKTQDLSTASPPDGCVEAKRIEGTANLVLLPSGGTMCAIDPDLILIALTIGNVGANSGVAASDAVIEASLGVAPKPTSTPSS
jgi:hypothetical protein